MKTTTNRTRRTFLVMFNLALVLALALAVLPRLAAAAPINVAATCTTNYTVQAGDTLTSIAAKYNVNWRDIATANNLLEPYTLTVGQVLCIPGVASTTPATGGTTTSNQPDIKVDKWTKTSVTISISGFTKKIPYVVKATKDQYGARTYNLLGRMRTDKNGTATKTFLLPKGLRSQSVLVICVKNSFNDVATCKLFRAP